MHSCNLAPHYTVNLRESELSVKKNTANVRAHGNSLRCAWEEEEERRALQLTGTTMRKLKRWMKRWKKKYTNSSVKHWQKRTEDYTKGTDGWSVVCVCVLLLKGAQKDESKSEVKHSSAVSFGHTGDQLSSSSSSSSWSCSRQSFFSSSAAVNLHCLALNHPVTLSSFLLLIIIIIIAR